MKSLALFLSLPLPLFAADPRFVTVFPCDRLEVRAGEAIELVTMVASSIELTFPGRPTPTYFSPLDKPVAVAGPATLRIGRIPNPVFNPSFFECEGLEPGFATFRIWPGATDPQSVALVPPGTNAVTLRLEASTNLVTWSAVHEVTLTSVPAATFYRAKTSP
jgi:hypothetical protein